MEVFLWHVGDPGFQTGVGKDMGIHQSTVSRAFATVVEATFAKADSWIQFLVDPADFQAAKDDWQNKFTCPCAIGALDCSHVTQRQLMRLFAVKLILSYEQKCKVRSEFLKN